MLNAWYVPDGTRARSCQRRGQARQPGSDASGTRAAIDGALVFHWGHDIGPNRSQTAILVYSVAGTMRGYAARRAGRADDPDAAEGFHVYVDPGGHPFCLCWG